MAKPARKSDSLKEVAREWSKKWSDDVSEDDVLSYAQDGRLKINTLITRKHFHVLNQEEIDDSQNRIAPDGTTWIFNTFVPLEKKWASVLLQGEMIPMTCLSFNDMALEPVGGPLLSEKKDQFVLLEDKIKFEQLINNTRREEEKPLATVSDNTLLATIAALLAAWPGGNKGKFPSAKELEQAANISGVSISDDSIRKALNLAREIAPGLKSA